MTDRNPPQQITTFFLITLVFALNAYIYATNATNASRVIPHLYYGVLILAGLYVGHRGQYLLLLLTSASNIFEAVIFPHSNEALAAIALFPFVGLFILRTIQSLQKAREKVDASLAALDMSHAALENRVLELTALFDISGAAGATLDLEKLFQQTMEILALKLGMHRGTLGLWDQESQVLRVEAAYGLTKAEKQRGEYQKWEGLTGTVMAKAEPIAVKNLSGEPMFLNRMGARELTKDEIAFLCVPVQLEGEMLGTLSVDKASERFSLEDDLRILTIVASVVAQAVRINQMVAARVESERLIAVGKMATTVAHEVRNPLGGIRGAAQLLEMELPTDSDGQACIQVILDEVDRLNAVIESLLTFGKPQVPQLAPHDLLALLQGTVRMHADNFSQHGMEAHIQAPENLPSICLDANQCSQVFHNLIRNAIEATPEGGQLTIEVHLEPESVEIEFCDTGSGIPENVRRRLFDPFYTTKPKGTGLGLAISAQIIQEHQGSIEVASSDTGGTCFKIILPRLTTSQNLAETP